MTWKEAFPPMTITLDLTPEEVAVLRRRADAEGVSIEAVLHGLVAALAPPAAPPEVSKEDPEERDREQAELRANLDRWRAEQGRPPLG